MTGEPLTKVQVLAEPSGERQPPARTTTDSNGHFALVHLQSGEYRLKGIRNGYLDTYYGARRADSKGTSLTLGPGVESKDLQLKLLPFAVVAGTAVPNPERSSGKVLREGRPVRAKRTKRGSLAGRLSRSCLARRATCRFQFMVELLKGHEIPALDFGAPQFGRSDVKRRLPRYFYLAARRRQEGLAVFIIGSHIAGTDVIDPSMQRKIAFFQSSRNRGMGT